MRGAILTITLVTLSILLVVVLAFGIVSYWHPLATEYWSPTSNTVYGIDAGIHDGLAYVVVCTSVSAPPKTRVDTSRELWGIQYFWQQDVNWAEFRCGDGTPRKVGYARDTCVKIPFWLAAVPLAACLVLAFVRRPLRRAARKRKGLCPSCGYNLTGSASGRCPECGAAYDGLQSPGDGD